MLLSLRKPIQILQNYPPFDHCQAKDRLKTKNSPTTGDFQLFMRTFRCGNAV